MRGVAGDLLGKDENFIYQANMGPETALPLTSKVLNGSLILQDYSISMGQCKALAAVFSQGRSSYI